MFTKKRIGSVLEPLGFGVFAKFMTDVFFEDNPLNFIPAAIGCFCCVTGTYLKCSGAAAERKPSCTSTEMIKQSLDLATGAGVVMGVVNFIKHNNTVSGNLADISVGLFLRYAVSELDKAAVAIESPLKWEKVRFVILVLADYLSASSMQKLMNGESLDLASKIFLPVGTLISLLEFVFGRIYDVGLDLSSAMLRRSFKLGAAMNFIFTGIDFIKQDFEKYKTADNAYSILTGLLLILTVMHLRKLAVNNSRVDEFSGVTVESPREYKQFFDEENPDTLNSKGIEEFKKGNYERAEAYFLLAIPFFTMHEMNNKESLLKLASIDYNLGSTFLKRGKYAEAQKILEAAMAIRKTYLDANDSLIKKTEDKLNECRAAPLGDSSQPGIRRSYA